MYTERETKSECDKARQQQQNRTKKREREREKAATICNTAETVSRGESCSPVEKRNTAEACSGAHMTNHVALSHIPSAFTKTTEVPPRRSLALSNAELCFGETIRSPPMKQDESNAKRASIPFLFFFIRRNRHESLRSLQGLGQ
jgi:hypothetical protein